MKKPNHCQGFFQGKSLKTSAGHRWGILAFSRRCLTVLKVYGILW
jgi:hypothetical protein